MKKDQAVHLFKKMKPLMDEKIVWFVYYNERPIAMFLNIPDLNQYFKYFDGKLGPLQKLYFLWLRRHGACKRFTVTLFAIIPDSPSQLPYTYLLTKPSNIPHHQPPTPHSSL